MIKKIEACGFKSFKDLSLDMRSLTVLCGANGSGKSSVLQLLLLLKENAIAGIGECEAKLNSTLLNLGKQSDVLYRWAQGSDCCVTLESDAGTYSSRADLGASDDDFMVLHSSVAANDDFIGWLRKDIRYLSADRLAPQTHHRNSAYEVKKRNVGRNGENAVAMFFALGDVDVPAELCHEAIGSDAVDRTLKGQVNAWMKEISYGVSLQAVANGDQVDLHVDYGGAKLDKGFRPENVGFGISYVLPVLVMVLTAKQGECVLIENPGAHLHPQGQAQLGRLLTRAAAYGIQVVIETHSDHILNGIRVACKKIADADPLSCEEDSSGVRYFKGAVINFFKRVRRRVELFEENYTTVERIRIESNGEVESYPEGFLDEWPNQMGELV